MKRRLCYAVSSFLHIICSPPLWDRSSTELSRSETIMQDIFAWHEWEWRNTSSYAAAWEVFVALYSWEAMGSLFASLLLRNVRQKSHSARKCWTELAIFYLISRSLTSKTSVLFAGIPGFLELPYAKLAGIVSLRSPPTDIPRTPMSQPLMTSPAPSLNWNALPFLFAVLRVSRRV